MRWEFIYRRDISWPELEKVHKTLIDQVKSDNSQAFLLISEPWPTFTYGRSSAPSDLVWSKELLDKEGVAVFPVTRGGKWTYHGPGQILIYPILHLPSHGYSSKSVRIFLEDLRWTVKEELEVLGCSELTSEEPFGLYLGHKKLVSFGFAFERGISSNGLAVYYTEQARFFAGIHPCGVCQGQSTSLSDLLPSQLSWNSVASSLADRIKNHLSLRSSRVL